MKSGVLFCGKTPAVRAVSCPAFYEALRIWREKFCERGIMDTPIEVKTTVTAAPKAAGTVPKAKDEIAIIAQKWKKKRGSLIMALHDLQGRLGYVPRESAMRLGREMDVPLARIYEVITFYNYFKLEAPGKYIISVCTGTACHLKGSGNLLEGLKKELNVQEGQSTPDKEYHLQAVRCLGCCGLAPLVSVNGKVYGKLKTDESHYVIERIQQDKPMVNAPQEDPAE
jgi:NADH:ubiquinone oxidoreductase subunit E